MDDMDRLSTRTLLYTALLCVHACVCVCFMLCLFFLIRIQPLSGQVSAVTQLLSEAYVQSTGTPTSSACSDTPSTSHDMSRDMPSTSHDDMSSTSHDMSHDASHDASHDMPSKSDDMPSTHISHYHLTQLQELKKRV